MTSHPICANDLLHGQRANRGYIFRPPVQGARIPPSPAQPPTEKIVRTAALVLLLGCTCLAASSPERETSATRADVPHDVTLRIEAMGTAPVVVHVVSISGGLRLASDTSALEQPELVVRTPAQVVVGKSVDQLELTTEHNLAVSVRFDAGASARERALRPWGRALLFRRSAEGDLVPQAHAMQLVPTE